MTGEDLIETTVSTPDFSKVLQDERVRDIVNLVFDRPKCDLTIQEFEEVKVYLTEDGILPAMFGKATFAVFNDLRVQRGLPATRV